MTNNKTPLEALKHHVTGAIERGEKAAIVAVEKPQHTPVSYKFRLIGRATIFTAVYEYLAAGFIPAVYGETENGKFSTQPRIADIVKLEA